MSRWRLLPRSVFAHVLMTVVLVLVGSTLLTIGLFRWMDVQPGTRHLLQVLSGFAALAEQADRQGAPGDAERLLRAAGLEVRHQPPTVPSPRLAPVLDTLRAHAGERLGPARALDIERSGGQVRLWLKLATRTPLWVGFAHDPRPAVRRLSLLVLAGCAALVWLAAALSARRLVQPLRRLARQAPAIMRGEAPAKLAVGAPREVGELADALVGASDDVRAAAEERNLMLAGISHDLRTPLTRLQYALALTPQIEPALRDGMERDIVEIDAILSQFIAYARDGRDETCEHVDLAALCTGALTAARQRWDAELPAQAWTHARPVALARALENLIGNAERHGAPPFRLTLRRIDAQWQLDIDDHGPGLGADEAERARRPFVHDSQAGGSGLGLPIVERIARQHGGRLDLLAVVPHGLRARLLLPAHDDPPGAPP